MFASWWCNHLIINTHVKSFFKKNNFGSNDAGTTINIRTSERGRGSSGNTDALISTFAYFLPCHFSISGSSKVEEACDMYVRAANMFKMAKKWSQAGNAFCEAAQLHLKSGSRHDAATAYVDAGNCFKKVDPNGNKSLTCIENVCFKKVLVEIAKFIHSFQRRHLYCWKLWRSIRTW